MLRNILFLPALLLFCCNAGVDDGRYRDYGTHAVILESHPINNGKNKGIFRAVIDELTWECMRNYRQNMSEIQTAFTSSRIPPMNIEAYLNRIRKYTTFRDEIFALALIYMNRISALPSSPVTITLLTVHRLTATAILMAYKFFDAELAAFRLSAYSGIVGIPHIELVMLEHVFLVEIRFHLFVSRRVVCSISSIQLTAFSGNVSCDVCDALSGDDGKKSTFMDEASAFN